MRRAPGEMVVAARHDHGRACMPRRRLKASEIKGEGRLAMKTQIRPESSPSSRDADRGRRPVDQPTRRAVSAAVIRNPFAGASSRISPPPDIGAELGDPPAAARRRALGTTP